MFRLKVGQFVLEVGKYYWILDDLSIPIKINNNIFHKLTFAKLTHRTIEYDCEKYYFKPKNCKGYVYVFEFDITKFVFDTKDDFLVWLVNYVNALKHFTVEVESDIKNKISYSQSLYPEKWI